MLSACVKQSDLSHSDKSSVFTFEDVTGFKMDQYIVKPLKNGKEYFYTKSNTEINGISFMYSVVLMDELGKEIKLLANMNLQPDEERAAELFNSSSKTAKALNKKSIKDTDASAYNANELLIVHSKDYFSLFMRKDNLYYNLEIDGVSINQEQIKDNLLKKVDFILNTGMKDSFE